MEFNQTTIQALVKKILPFFLVLIFLVYIGLWGSINIEERRISSTHLSTQSNTTFSTLLKCPQQNKLPFQFEPSTDKMPFAGTAVLTMLDSNDLPARDDFQFLNTMLMIYSLKHNNTIQLSNAEFGVLIKQPLRTEKKAMLLEMGARLILVDSSNFKGDKWRNAFVKLHMFQMLFYKQILYASPEIMFIKSPQRMFDEMNAVKSKRKGPFFGAVSDWGRSKEFFSAGMFMLEPSCDLFTKSVKLIDGSVKNPSWNEDQDLLNHLFKQDKTGPAGVAWYGFSTYFNFQWVSRRPMSEFMKGYGLNFQMMGEQIHPDIFKMWRTNFLGMLEFQKGFQEALDITFVPQSQLLLEKMIKNGVFGANPLGENFDKKKIAIYTLLAGSELDKSYEPKRIVSSRERYVNKWGYSHHFQKTLDKVRFPVWQKVYDAEKLVKEYDWIWFLDADAYIMNADIPLHELLASYLLENPKTGLVIANDCNGFNAGSFLVHSTPWTNELLQEWKGLEYKDNFPNAHLWREQAALSHLYNTNVKNAKKYVKVVPQRDINAYAGSYCGYGYQPGDFVVHSPGMGYKGVKDFLAKHQYKEV